MEYAVFASGGKQYKVKPGDTVELEKLEGVEGDAITFDNVLLHSLEGGITVGQPTIAGVNIVGKILGQMKGVKIRVAKFKAKARYRRVQGHRQLLTQVKIEKIVSKAKKTKAAEDEK